MRVDPNDCSDAELIRAAGADAAAFGVLYQRHALRVYTWSRRRLDWAASDLTAETFAQAWLGRRLADNLRFGSSGLAALPFLDQGPAREGLVSARRNRTRQSQ